MAVLTYSPYSAELVMQELQRLNTLCKLYCTVLYHVLLEVFPSVDVRMGRATF